MDRSEIEGVLIDVRYAMGQLRRTTGAKQSIEGMMMRDSVERALDALERVESTLTVIHAELPELNDGCEECARSFGSNYSGPCSH